MSVDSSTISWPGWETVELIGRGSFGAVYKIRRDVLGMEEEAALKVISIPQNAGDIEEMYSDGYDDESITSTFHSHLKSIVEEYSLMRKMNGCSNIVSCDDIRYVQHDDGIGWDIFIKMELLTPLSKGLPSDFSEDTVLRIAKDLCTALTLCKKFDIVHRDIKPQNIFISPMGDYKLGDFGIAKTVEKTMGGTKIGTYKYMAPEVYHSQPYGATADIYSLGLVLYWLLNERRLPFLPLPPAKIKAGDEDKARLRRFSGEKLPPPANGSEKLKKIVLKACSFDPKDRYASAREMLNALNDAVPVFVPAVPEEKVVSPVTPVENPVQTDDEDATVGLFFHNKAREQQEAQAEAERLAQEKAEAERMAGEQEDAQRLAREQAERDRLARQKEELQRILKEREAAEQQARIEEERRQQAEAEALRKQQAEAEARTEAAWRKAEEAHRQLQSSQEAKQQEPALPAKPSGRRKVLTALAVICLVLVCAAAGYRYIAFQKLDPALTRQGRLVYYYQGGSKQTGWESINGHRYFFDLNGAMRTGWQKVSTSWYYFAENGIMQTGWKKLGGVQYYFGNDGAMKTGWVDMNTGMHYFDSEGAMQTGWQKIGRSWYYFTKFGNMQTGWRKLGGVQYYFGKDGAMRTGEQIIDGNRYTFDSEGALIGSR